MTKGEKLLINFENAAANLRRVLHSHVHYPDLQNRYIATRLALVEYFEKLERPDAQ